MKAVAGRVSRPPERPGCAGTFDLHGTVRTPQPAEVPISIALAPRLPLLEEKRLVSTTVGILIALVGVVLAGIGIYLVVLALANLAYRPGPYAPSRPHRSHLTVVVPAHDEELLVGRCIRSLLAQSYPADLMRVVVVADNCTDATATVAAGAGADVMIRDQADQPGKGRALRWAMDILLAGAAPPDGIVVVDADSVADPNLLGALAVELESGLDVVQADYTLQEEPGLRRSAMAEAGFLLFHRVRFGGRARLGMPANLVGNGMLFSRRALEMEPWSAFTGVEDLEQSIRFRVAGFQPRFAPAALVSGPGPASSAGAVRQRLRWEGGRFHIVRRQLGSLIVAAVVRRDPRLADAAVDLATPPLALFSLASLAGALVSLTLAVTGLVAWWVAIPWMTAVVAIPTFVMVGLWSAGSPVRIREVMLGAPMFIGWKLLTYLRLLRGHDADRWDRTDRQVS